MYNFTSNRTTDIGSIIYTYTSIALIPVFAFALILNILLLYILVQYAIFQSIAYKLIRMSVISDALSSLTATVGYSLVAQEFSYQSGKILCQIILNIVFTFNGVSMNNLCLIALDRYFAILKPFSPFYRRYRRSIFLLGQVGSWSLSILYNQPLITYIGGAREDPTLCDVPEIDRYAIIPILLIMFCFLQYILPCSWIGYIYWRIIQHQKHYVRPGAISTLHQEQELKKKKFIKILVTITLWYVLATWPFFAGIAGMAITRKSVFAVRKNSLIEFLFLFYSLGTSICITLINPLIYLKFDHNIRKKFLDMILRREKRGKLLSKSFSTKIRPIPASNLSQEAKLTSSATKPIKTQQQSIPSISYDSNHEILDNRKYLTEVRSIANISKSNRRPCISTAMRVNHSEIINQSLLPGYVPD